MGQDFKSSTKLFGWITNCITNETLILKINADGRDIFVVLKNWSTKLYHKINNFGHI